MANDVSRMLVSVFATGSDRSWVQVEPLYRKHRIDEIFAVRIAIPRREVFPVRFRLAAHLRKGCGYRSVQYERADHLRLLCDWRHTEPAPSDTEWSLRVMNVFNAWDITPPNGGARKGLGVVIGHPDTGWNVHPEYDVERIDVERAHNTLFDSTGEDAAKHPTFFQFFPINNLTHGTGTGSVMVSGVADGRRTQVNPVPRRAGEATKGEVEITGVAPRATILPVRCLDAVELAPDNRNLGRAIEYLMDLNDPPVSVISISVGGAPHYSLEGIIRRAVTEKNIIVVAATGQYAFSTWDNSVIEPADYQHVVAVAGCTDIPHPWASSLQGPRVAVSAPARGVYCADYENSSTVTPIVLWGEGTSFSAAEVAGIAALWTAFWGRDALLAKYGGQVPLAFVFRQLLMQTANPLRVVNNTNPFFPCSEPWPADRFGAGVVDAAALLRSPLPDPGDVATPPLQSDQNIITQLPDMDRWFGDKLEQAAQMGEDAYNEVREWLDQGTIWFEARAHEAERAATEIGDGLLTLWTDAAAAAEDAAGDVQRGLNQVAAALGEAWQGAADAVEDAATDAADGVEEFVAGAEQFVEDIAEGGTEAAGDVVDAVAGWLGL